MGDNKYSHTNMQKYIIDAGFDMSSTANRMQQYYLDSYGQI